MFLVLFNLISIINIINQCGEVCLPWLEMRSTLYKLLLGLLC